jgi:hypothetical protein
VLELIISSVSRSLRQKPAAAIMCRILEE